MYTINVPDGVGPIWLDDVRCSGTETSIFRCPNRGLGVHNCVHFEDVGVSCSGGQNESVEIREKFLINTCNLFCVGKIVMNEK